MDDSYALGRECFIHCLTDIIKTLTDTKKIGDPPQFVFLKFRSSQLQFCEWDRSRSQPGIDGLAKNADKLLSELNLAFYCPSSELTLKILSNLLRGIFQWVCALRLMDILHSSSTHEAIYLRLAQVFSSQSQPPIRSVRLS